MSTSIDIPPRDSSTPSPGSSSCHHHGCDAPQASFNESCTSVTVHGIDLDRLERELELLRGLEIEADTSPVADSMSEDVETSSITGAVGKSVDMQEVRSALRHVQYAQVKLSQLGLLSEASEISAVTVSCESDELEKRAGADVRHDVSLASDASEVSRSRMRNTLENIQLTIQKLHMHEDTMHDVGSDDELSEGDMEAPDVALVRKHSTTIAAPRGFMSYIDEGEKSALSVSLNTVTRGSQRSQGTSGTSHRTNASSASHRSRSHSSYSWGTVSATNDECVSISEDVKPDEEAKPCGFLHLVGDEPAAPMGFMQFVTEPSSKETLSTTSRSSDRDEPVSEYFTNSSDCSDGVGDDEDDDDVCSLSDCPSLEMITCLSATKDEERAYRKWVTKTVRVGKAELRGNSVTCRLAVFLHFYRCGIPPQDIVPRKIRTIKSWQKQGRHIISESTHIRVPVIELKFSSRSAEQSLFETTAPPACSALWWFHREAPNHEKVMSATKTTRVCHFNDTASLVSTKGKGSKADKKIFHLMVATSTNPSLILNTPLASSALKEMRLQWIVNVLQRNERTSASRNAAIAIHSHFHRCSLSERHRILKLFDSNPRTRSVLYSQLEGLGLELYSQIAPGDVHLGETVITGSRSRVFASSWKSQAVAAIHHFPLRSFDGATFARSMSLAALCDHPNILRVYGGHVSEKENMAVCDLKGRGSLNRMVRAKEHILMDIQMVVNILKCIAVGLKYLHERHFVLRGLSSGIILLGYELSDVCIGTLRDAHFWFGPEDCCAFELSRYQPFVAPEILRSDSYSFAADIYSFGMIVWEIVNMKEPFSNLNPTDIVPEVLSGERPSISPGCQPRLRELIEACWHQEPSKRPAIDQVLQMIASISADVGEGSH
eukprot:TRINITY_DN5199_c0_g1_i1.p1 TRINITY_DN5199_c0_g1~~TRINITY_DN5199_c0_g1_i1.p1  ORF type:complete len:889 (-),score=160.18 TRINITY_DN5199_c0_g1_i1:230-2896(-)